VVVAVFVVAAGLLLLPLEEEESASQAPGESVCAPSNSSRKRY